MAILKNPLFSHIENEYSVASEKFKNLRKPILEDDQIVIYGRLDAIDIDGNNWDTYEVKIVISETYPNELPILFEIGGKIERHPDWHISRDGSCCLGPRIKLIRDLNGNITLIRWLEIHVIPFLANHFYKIKNGEYAGKHYSHGANGIVEYYQELWNIFKKSDIINKLKLITHRSKIGRNDKCFCGSNEKYKKCHLNSRDFEGVPNEHYLKDLLDIQ